MYATSLILMQIQARGDVSLMNIDRDKVKKEVWLLAIHSRIKNYINGNETFLNTFTR